MRDRQRSIGREERINHRVYKCIWCKIPFTTKHKPLMHQMRWKPQFCCPEHKEQHIAWQKAMAAKVLEKFHKDS